MATQEMLASIANGWHVLDSADKSVGTVKEVYFGTSSDEAEAYTTQTVVGPDDGGITPDLAETFGAGHELPDMIRKRLLTHGYIRIDSGFGGDYFAMADQVGEVSNNEVRLTVPIRELVH
jgi:hypothetical protein